MQVRHRIIDAMQHISVEESVQKQCLCSNDGMAEGKASVSEEKTAAIKRLINTIYNGILHRPQRRFETK